MRALLLATGLVVAMVGQAAAAEWKRLMEPADLAPLIGEVIVLDIRPGKQFGQGHVETARHAPYGSWRGPKENPGRALDDSALTERLQSLGIEPDDRVVVTYQGVNATDFGSAARVYWTLKSAGLTQIAILNGGVTAWQGAGMELKMGPAEFERSTAEFTLSDEWMISRDGVRAVVDGSADAQIVDARPLPFLQGKKKHRAAKTAGTIEGAAQVTHSTWFKKRDKTRISSAEDVLRLAREAGVEDGQSRPIASFCNTGHWAATNWFALSELAGIANVKLYPESMVGWTNADQPVVKTE
ncbi:MAG: rhodanese-like domain-containing protein [Pseudomonadota bacterium]